MGQTIDISQDKIAGGGRSSPVIAYAIGVNLKTVGSNPFTWMTGKTAANTGNHRLYARLSSDQPYTGDAVAEQAATTTIVFNPANFPPDSLTLGYAVKIYVGATAVYDAYEPAGFLGETPNLSVWMNYVMGKFQEIAVPYDAVIDGGEMDLTGPIGSGSSINGEVVTIEYRDENAPTFTDSLSSSPAFSGGVDAHDAANFALDLNGSDMVPYEGVLIDGIAALVFEEQSFSKLLKKTGSPVIPMTGDYNIEVASGTIDDYVVDFFISGDLNQ